MKIYIRRLKQLTVLHYQSITGHSKHNTAAKKSSQYLSLRQS